MKFFKFVFSFLYQRNWHTGNKELSVVRVVILLGGIGLIALLVVLGLWLQSPATYEAQALVSLVKTSVQ